MLLIYTNENVIKYQKHPSEKTDKFSLGMLNQGTIKNLIICGDTEKEILIPISNLIPLEEYLRNCTHLQFLNVLKEAASTYNLSNQYMLGKSTIIYHLSYAFVLEDSLKLICLPTNFANAFTLPLKDFLREILVAGWNNELFSSSLFQLAHLLNDSEDFSPTNFIAKINELETEPPPTKVEKSQIKRGSRIKSWFFGKDDNSTTAYNSEELPFGISVLAVRSSGAEYPLAFGPDVIGTNENSCSIAFKNSENPNIPNISPEHCRVLFESGKYFLEDLGSETGTFLNNERIDLGKKYPLSYADLIKVGGEEIVFSHRI